MAKYDRDKDGRGSDEVRGNRGGRWVGKFLPRRIQVTRVSNLFVCPSEIPHQSSLSRKRNLVPEMSNSSPSPRGTRVLRIASIRGTRRSSEGGGRGDGEGVKGEGRRQSHLPSDDDDEEEEETHAKFFLGYFISARPSLTS